MNSDFLETLSRVSSVKKTMTALPIIQQQVQVSPLVVGDDLALRTSLTSPVFYDREIVKLIYARTEFPEEKELSYEEFIATISNVDKLSLIWALFKATYETLGERQFFCPKENCTHNKNPFKNEVLLQDIIQEDTYRIWEEEESFHKYTYQIDIPHKDVIYSFMARLPSIAHNNQILATVSTETLQNNLEKTGSIYSRAQSMALLVEAMQVSGSSEESNINPVQTHNLQELMIAFNSYVPFTVSEEFLDKYNEKFEKYVPNFYKKVECPGCGEEVRNDFDLEVEFFRRGLFGSGESE
ncbi:MAG: hypothetical protein R3250_06810 [Melioribacteraceae bacterium]|nr:hypothetical protein [Melioribacteraceae bacterium]